MQFGARAILGRGVVGGIGAVILARVGKWRCSVTRQVLGGNERKWANEPRSGEGVPGRAIRLAAVEVTW